MNFFFTFLIFCFLCFFSAGPAFSQNTDDVLDLDLNFKVEDVQKKPYSLNADIEAKGTLRFFDRDALLFKQKYPDKKNKDSAWQTDLDATIEAQYQKDPFKLYGRFNSFFYYNEDENFESETKVKEAYLTFQPTFSWAFDTGKKVHKWGKGYAFSPSAFFSRPKDLDDPDATLEGYYSFSADYIKSREGILQTFAITPVLMPVTRDLNHELGTEDELIWGGKLYFFAYDTDLDFMFLISENLDDRLGIDFYKNLSPSF